ncbi:MAG: sugar phosphate isomerase/epimerase [Thermoprotei archaeon]|nr:MAG: sugar phosphate isomerase/epimerase [Thermoprotei archaeon]
MMSRSIKLSVITDEVSQELARVIDFAVNHGLEGIEVRTLWNMKPHELVDKAGEIRKELESAGLEVSAIASPVFKCDLLSEEEYREHMDILERCIALAKALDTRIIRIFTFWRKGSLDQYLDQILEKFMAAVDVAASEGVVLAVENEPSTHVNNGRRLRQFLDAVSKPNVVSGVWDPGNDVFDPEGEQPYPEGYSYVRGFFVHVHVKDGRRVDGGYEFTPVGEGEVNWLEQLKALVRDRYTGYLSLETHWRPKQLPRELVELPGGEAYSAMGEYASIICIRNLKSLLERVAGEGP